MNKHNIKLFFVSATVALVLLAIVSVNFTKAFNSKANIQNFQTSINLSANISQAIHELQKERGLSSGYINSKGDNFSSKLKNQITQTNKRIKELKKFIKVNNYKLNEQLENALKSMTQIDVRRKDISNLSEKCTVHVVYYTDLIKMLIEVNIDIFKTKDYVNISDKLIGYSNFLLLKEDSAIERKLGTSIITKDFMMLDDKKMFNNIIVSQENHEKKFLEHSNKNIKDIYSNTLNKDEIKQINKIRQIILNAHEVGGFNVNAEKWFNEATLKIDQLSTVQEHILANLRVDSKKLKEKLTLIGITSKLLDAIQNERGTTAGFIGSNGKKFKDALLKKRLLTDSIINIYTLEIKKNSKNSNKVLKTILINIEKELNVISSIRLKVDKLKNKDNKVIKYYRSINLLSLKLISELLKDAKTTSELKDLGALYNLLMIKELLGLERAILSNAFARNKFFTGFKTRFIKLITEQETYLKNFKMCANDDFLSFYNKHYSSYDEKNINQFRNVAKNTINTGGFNQDPLNWFNLSTIKINNLKNIEDTLIQEILNATNEELEIVTNSANTYIIVGIFILIFGGVGIVFFITKENKLKEAITQNNNKLMLLVDEKTKDINKQKKELEQLVDSFDRNVIFSRTDTKGIITHVSKAFCTISGYTKSELLGKPHNLVRHPDMPKEAFAEMWSTIQNEACWVGEVKNRKKDGSAYWVFSKVEPDYDYDGDLIGYSAVRQEITAQKEVEELSSKLEIKVEERTKELHQLALNLEQKVQEQIDELREKDTSLLEQSKMASMGEMIGNIAHQWRQPLSAISTTASGMQLNSQLGILTNEEIPKYLDTILGKAKFLSETINIFMHFMDKDKELKEVVLQDRIDNAIKIVESSYDDNAIEIINNINYDDSIVTNMVPGELPQVIINILNNSKDILEISNPKEKWIKINLEKIDNNAQITIEDNGGGIPEDIISKVFEPYFTTKHQSQGTGMGLNICYKIVTQSLNGKLYVKNTPNGAKFYIEFPFN